MRVIALLSGGKDSMLNMMYCVANGHTVVGIAHMKPPVEELDSYMYQSVGHNALPLIAESLGLPLYQKTILGRPHIVTLEYDGDISQTDEVEDLYTLLKELVEAAGMEGVSVGAVLSNYQRIRVQNICDRLNIKMLAYLWESNQHKLIQAMTDPRCGLDVRIIKTATMGLNGSHLGKSLVEMKDTLFSLHEKWKISVAGEGGEYESLCLDSPLFEKRIEMDQSEIVMHADQSDAPVAYLLLKGLRLVEKEPSNGNWRDFILSNSIHN